MEKISTFSCNQIHHCNFFIILVYFNICVLLCGEMLLYKSLLIIIMICFFFVFLFIWFIGIKFHNFFLYKVISISWPELQVWWVSLSFFCHFLKLIFYHISSFNGWLKIKLHNLFWFAFYKVISVLWFGSRTLWINPIHPSYFFKLHHSMLDWLRIKFHILLRFTFYDVILN